MKCRRRKRKSKSKTANDCATKERVPSVGLELLSGIIDWFSTNIIVNFLTYIILYPIWIVSDVLRGLRRMPLILLIVIVSMMVIPCKTASGLPDVQVDNAPLPIGPIVVAVSAAATASGYSLANPPKDRTVVPPKPKPKKRRKRPTAQRRKKLTFNYAAAKIQLNLDPSASYQELCAAIKPVAGLTLPKSPDKSQLKRESKILRKDVAREKSRDKLNREITVIKKKADRKRAQDSVTILNNENDLKSMRKKCREGSSNPAEEKKTTKILKKENNKCEKKLAEEKESAKMLINDNDKIQKKVLSLEKNVTSLSNLLKEEKEKLRIVVADLMARAEAAMNDAHNLSSSLARKEKELELEMFASKEREKDVVRE